MSKQHFGNISIYGYAEIGISGDQYILPLQRGNKKGYTIIDISGDGKHLVFGDISPYIDLSKVPGSDQIIQNHNHLLSVISSYNGVVDKFQELLDVQGNITGHSGKFIIVNENAHNPSQIEKVSYANLTVSDLQNQLDTINTQIQEISASFNALQGKVQINPNQKIYTINHITIDPATDFPFVTLEIPSEDNQIFIEAITNRTATSFKVVLSNTINNNTSGYYILWSLKRSKAFFKENLVKVITTNYNIQPQDDVIVVDKDISNLINVFLPINPSNGKIVFIRNHSENYSIKIKTLDGSKLNYINDEIIVQKQRAVTCIWINNSIGWSILV